MRDLFTSVRGIEQAVKIEMAAGAQISAQLRGQLLLALDPLAVTRGRELHHAVMSKRRARVNGQQLTQLIEFEHALAGVMDWAGSAHQGCVAMVQEPKLRSAASSSTA